MHGADAAAKTNHEDHGGQRGREAHLPQQRQRVKRPTPAATLLHGLQGLCEPHARRGQQIWRDLKLRQSAHLGVEHAHGFQLNGALGAALSVTFQLVTRVIGQLIVEIQRDVFLHPIAIHVCLYFLL